MDALATDIKHNGQKLAIKQLPDGRILDGRNRELACLIAGVGPLYETARPSESEVRAYIESLNLHRRRGPPGVGAEPPEPGEEYPRHRRDGGGRASGLFMPT